MTEPATPADVAAAMQDDAPAPPSEGGFTYDIEAGRGELTPVVERTCTRCGCSDSRACPGGCSWVTLDPPVCSNCAGLAEPGFTVGEKLASLLDAIVTGPTPDDAGAAYAYRTLRLLVRLPMTRKLGSYFPDLDDEDGWHALIALLVGVLLNLPSDGAQLDLDAAAALGADTLASLMGA